MVVLIMFSTLVLSSVLLVIAGSVNNSYGQIEAPLEATAAAVDGGISVQEALNMMAIASKAVSEHVEADGCHELCLERVGSTPMGYWAPEVLDNYSTDPINYASDLFSVGCLLYTIKYGRYPFESRLATINFALSLPEDDSTIGLLIKRFLRSYQERM